MFSNAVREAVEWLTGGESSSNAEEADSRSTKSKKEKHEIALTEMTHLSELSAMFPHMERAVLCTLLEAAQNNLHLAIEAVLIIQQQEQKSEAARGLEVAEFRPRWNSISFTDEAEGPTTSKQYSSNVQPYALSRWERQVLAELRQLRRGKKVTLPEDFLRLPFISHKEKCRSQSPIPLEIPASNEAPPSATESNCHQQKNKSVLDEEYYTGGEYTVTLTKQYGGLGVTLKEKNGLLFVEGLYSGDSKEPGPAERAGVQIGDVLLGIEDSPAEQQGDSDLDPNAGKASENCPPGPQTSGSLQALSSTEELVAYLRTSRDVVNLRFSRPSDSVYVGLRKRATFPATHRLSVLLHEDELVDAIQAQQIDAQMSRLLARIHDWESGNLLPEFFSSSSPSESSSGRTWTDVNSSIKTSKSSIFKSTSLSRKLYKEEEQKPDSPAKPRERLRTKTALRPAISVRITGTDVEGAGSKAHTFTSSRLDFEHGCPSSPTGGTISDIKQGPSPSSGSGHTVYLIWVLDVQSGAEWQCVRRFTHFRRLQEYILRLHPPLAGIDFPPRVPETLAVINDRQERLERWLRCVLAHVFVAASVGSELAPAIYAVQDFLDLNSRLESLKMLDQCSDRCSRQKVQVWVHQLLCLPFFDKIISNFVKHLSKATQSGKLLLQQMKQFINHLQLTLLEGCYQELRKVIELEYEGSVQTWQYEEKVHAIISKGIRRQVESEVYVPLMGVLITNLRIELKEEEEVFQYKIQCAKHLPQSYFGVPLHRISPSSWEAAVVHLAAVDGFTLPCDKLDALVASANEIPVLFRQEHPGSDQPLGADEFLPIFIYILIHSGIQELLLLTSLLCDLCDPNKRLAETGYYLATFEAAIQHIRELDISS